MSQIAAGLPTGTRAAATAAALRAAPFIADAERRALILTGLAELVPPDEHPAVLTRAYTAAMAIEPEPDRYRRLAALIPACLPPADN